MEPLKTSIPTFLKKHKITVQEQYQKFIRWFPTQYPTTVFKYSDGYEFIAHHDHITWNLYVKFDGTADYTFSAFCI